MEIAFLNSSFERIFLLDSFNSLIWTDRYWRPGDFDVATAPTNDILAKLPDIAYATIPESEKLMFLETFHIRSDMKTGDDLILKGRSLESLLDRRVIYENLSLTGDFQTLIEDEILDRHIISAAVIPRRISNFEFLASTDPVITALTIDTQFAGETIEEAISELCISLDIGYKITLTATEQFRMEFYAGVDRSHDQTDNPYIIFSPENENLMNSEYIDSDAGYKSYCFVAGEKGVGNSRLVGGAYAPGTTGGTGLTRREMYIEANITRNPPGEPPLTTIEYYNQLTGRGLLELGKNVEIQVFDGEVDTNMYSFGEDYFMGDVVQLSDGYGHGTKSRVVEMIYSQDEKGEKQYPTFAMIKDE